MEKERESGQDSKSYKTKQEKITRKDERGTKPERKIEREREQEKKKKRKRIRDRTREKEKKKENKKKKTKKNRDRQTYRIENRRGRENTKRNERNSYITSFYDWPS